MAKVRKANTRAQKIAASQAGIDNVTSLVSRAGRPKLVASYQALVTHRAPVVARVKGAITEIERSYAESDRDDRDAHHKRADLANEMLDYLVEQFDHNGFSNPGDRLVMAWLMFSLLKPIGHRTTEICDLIEKTFHLRNQAISDHGLGCEIKRRRHRQHARQQEKKRAA